MRTIIITIALAVISSCDKNKEQFCLDTGIEITVSDESGNDLLNPSNQNAYTEDGIKIFYLINGRAIYVHYPNYDNPGNFSIREREGLFRMMLHLNTSEDEELPITYIKWNDSDTDTIKCRISRTTSLVMCTEVWYNGSLVWDDYSNCRCIQIVKKGNTQ